MYVLASSGRPRANLSEEINLISSKLHEGGGRTESPNWSGNSSV